MIFFSEQDYHSRRDVLASYSGAVRVSRVFGGWMVFFSFDDYDTWRRQK